jgi:hypothetical protein
LLQGHAIGGDFLSKKELEGRGSLVTRFPRLHPEECIEKQKLEGAEKMELEEAGRQELEKN